MPGKNKKVNDRADPAPFNWRSKSRTLFGHMHNGPRGSSLELSHHSSLALARENNRRLREGWDKYVISGEGASAQ